jgi:hypothetical protein
MNCFYWFALIFHALLCSLQADEWITKITTEEGNFTFGGPLLEKEENLLGKWKGENEEGDKWEIFRRPNHVFSIQVTWVEEGEKGSFFGHGLWAVKNSVFLYADILDFDIETDSDWPIEVKNRIPTEDIRVVEEKMKLSSKEKIITNSEDIGDSNETKVSSFEMPQMRQFNKTNPLKDAQLFDRVQLARIENVEDVTKFFTIASYSVDKKIVGKWKTTDNDPECDSDKISEFIRRADGSTTAVYNSEEDTEPPMTHGLCTIRNGKYYGVDLIEEQEIFPFDEIFLWGEEIVKSSPDEFATQWIDPQRKVLKFLPMVITVTDKRIDRFESKKLEKEYKENAYDLEFILKSVK